MMTQRSHQGDLSHQRCGFSIIFNVSGNDLICRILSIITHKLFKIIALSNFLFITKIAFVFYTNLIVYC